MTLEEQLGALDTRIRKLKIQFDLFFSGLLPKPPLDERDALERELKRLGNSRDMKLPQRFLYNTLLSRWNAYTELWGKRLAAREEGERTVPAARRRTRQAESPSRADASPAAPKEETRAGTSLVARACIRDAHDSADQVQSLYRAFLVAREKAGDAQPVPSYERFCREIDRHAAAIREKSSCERVDFRLYLQNNKVALKAKPYKQEEPS